MNAPASELHLRALALALASSLAERWHPGGPLELALGRPRRLAVEGSPTVVRYEAMVSRRHEELLFTLDAETSEVLAFEDPEGREGAEAAGAISAKAAVRAVGAADVVPLDAELLEVDLAPAKAEGAALWRLEFGAGGARTHRVEVHPLTGKIVGYFRLDRLAPGVEGGKP